MKALSICVSLIFLVKTIEASILHHVSETQFNLAVPATLKENVNLRINECGFAYQLLKPGATGEIITPNYPMEYPPNLNCIWWLKSIPGTNIHLKCYDVQTQSCTPDLFDYFLVSPDWTWKQYSILCGDNEKELPVELTSNENELSLFFRSSLRLHGRGVNCTYQVVEEKIENGLRFNGDEDICGKANKEDTRIVGGIQAGPSEFPWLVGLSLNDTWFCGGSLISPQWILTAAHCLSGATFANLLIGASHLTNHNSEKTVKLKSTEFFIHPDYSAEKIMNDVGLVKLPKKVTYSENIRPICLPLKKSQNEDINGRFMVAAGWGKTSDDGSISEALNKLTVEVISNNDCKKSFGADRIHETTLCAVGASRGTGTCQGDSGSALQYAIDIGRWVQIGVVSFGPATGCQNDYPSGYSKIAHYLDWISQVTDIAWQ